LSEQLKQRWSTTPNLSTGGDNWGKTITAHIARRALKEAQDAEGLRGPFAGGNRSREPAIELCASVNKGYLGETGGDVFQEAGKFYKGGLFLKETSLGGGNVPRG